MKLKIKFRLFQISTYALVFAAIILTALLTGKYIETIGLFISFVALLKELTKPKPFSVDTCTENELIARCKELRLSEENTNLAVEFFIKKTKQSIIANKLCIDEKSVQRKKTRLKAKLNNK